MNRHAMFVPNPQILKIKHKSKPVGIETMQQPGFQSPEVTHNNIYSINSVQSPEFSGVACLDINVKTPKARESIEKMREREKKQAFHEDYDDELFCDFYEHEHNTSDYLTFLTEALFDISDTKLIIENHERFRKTFFESAGFKNTIETHLLGFLKKISFFPDIFMFSNIQNINPLEKIVDAVMEETAQDLIKQRLENVLKLIKEPATVNDVPNVNKELIGAILLHFSTCALAHLEDSKSEIAEMLWNFIRDNHHNFFQITDKQTRSLILDTLNELKSSDNSQSWLQNVIEKNLLDDSSAKQFQEHEPTERTLFEKTPDKICIKKNPGNKNKSNVSGENGAQRCFTKPRNNVGLFCIRKVNVQAKKNTSEASFTQPRKISL